MLVVDGRSNISAGCNTRVVGEMLKHYGAYNAVNWDGGGSSCIYVRSLGQMNNGSDGSERACGNGMFAVADVPETDNTIVAIAPYQPIYSLPRYGVAAPQFLGYNKYGVMINTDVQGVKLSCAPEVGEILEDGRFLASGEAGGKLVATWGEVTTELDVRLEGDTGWLSQAQMSSLFQRERSVIGRHISNIYKEGELEKDTSCAKIAHKVVNVGNDAVQNYYTMYYNLDVIISVGYRVKSLRGTQFRIWANRVLKEYLVKGYAINHNAKAEQLEELKRTIAVMSDVLTAKSVTRDEAVGLLRVISDFSYGLDTLDRYDYQLLEVSHTTTEEHFRATYENAMEALQTLKREFGASELFAREKDESFRSTMGAIYQTFGGRDLYPSVEEKVANLLYLTVKNHSFSDGNKRIAAFLFLWFMERNGILYRNDGSRRVENNTLVALTLMIAESRVAEKDIMTKVIVNHSPRKTFGINRCSALLQVGTHQRLAARYDDENLVWIDIWRNLVEHAEEVAERHIALCGGGATVATAVATVEVASQRTLPE